LDIVQRQIWQDCEEEVEMNDKLFRTILKRYEAEIEDANYKIEAICEHNLVIPEHVDITGEIDKQLERIASAEDKLAAMRKYCGKKEARDIL
jgi:Mg2+ and Co2+ transporter CorA